MGNIIMRLHLITHINFLTYMSARFRELPYLSSFSTPMLSYSVQEPGTSFVVAAPRQDGLPAKEPEAGEVAVMIDGLGASLGHKLSICTKTAGTC